MARIKGLAESEAGLEIRLGYRMAKRRVGKIPEPMTVAAHHRWIFRGYGAFEMAFDRSRLVDAKLKALASLKAAARIGCPF